MIRLPLLSRRRVGRTALLLAVASTAAACVDDPTPPTALTGAGELAGFVFFDRDNNGAFTPTAGDSALGDVTVELRARGTTDVVATTQSNTDGSFRIAAPIGTHDLEIVRSADMIAASFVWCGARPSIYTNEVTFVPAPITFGCVVRISIAKQATQGSAITIAGIITAQPGRFRNDNLYVQDQTGGIQVFGVPGSLGLVEGDSLEISGTLGAFNDQLQITSPRFSANVKRGVPLPDPQQISTAQAAAATSAQSPLIGRLVRVRAVTVGSFAGGNAAIDDGSGAAQIRLDNNANSTIGTGFFTVGTCYDITGILGFFRGNSQLLPRSRQDITEVPCS